MSSAFPLGAGSVLTKERRVHIRVRVESVGVRLGRIDGALIDIGAGGARISHPGSLAVGTDVRLYFTLDEMEFAFPGRVLGSRVARLGSGGSTLYESRVKFIKPQRQLDELVREIARRVA